MRSLARFIVRFRVAIFCAFLALGAVGGVAAMHVEVNEDMTRYLPASMQVKQGMDLMDEEFGEAAVIELMVEGVPPDERAALADELAGFDSIFAVAYDEDDPSCNNGDFALYEATVKANPYSDEALSAAHLLQHACESRGYECWADSDALSNEANNITGVLVIAVVIAMVILFILADSWIEPLLLLFTILVAVCINMGSNIFLGSISSVSSACGAILQMALSMDYLIMLLNRYRRELADAGEPMLAMENAICGGVRAIASSSVTTIAGLLCLLLMSFTIGRDMGLVLAKGVALSLLCAFAMMPALVLWFDGVMQRTAKPSPHPQMRRLAACSYRLRYAVAVLLVVIFVAGLALRGLAMPSFITESKSPGSSAIEEHFDVGSQTVVLYDRSAQDAAAALADELGKLEGVRAVVSYPGGIGKQRDAAQMAAEVGMDEALLRIIYYDARHGLEGTVANGSALASYVRSGLAADLGELIDEDSAAKLGDAADILEEALGTGSYSAEGAAAALSTHPSIHRGMLELFLLAYGASSAYDETWTMSADELISFAGGPMLDEPAFAETLDRKTRSALESAAASAADARGTLVSAEYGRIILDVAYAPDSNEMDALCTQIRSRADAGLGAETYFLVGQGPMVQEMAASFSHELNLISIITIAVIALIVLVTFRSIPIPILLVGLIQSAFSWDMAITGMAGYSVYYIAMLVVQSMLMGATIDYAILFTANYREARLGQDVRGSIGEAYRNSIRTISMSGSILVLACLSLGLFAGGVTGQICMVISIGALISVLLVLLVLPGSMAALDRLVVGKRRTASQKTAAGQ